MNQPDIAQLLARIQLLDNRAVDRTVLAHWQQTLSEVPGIRDITLDEALQAVVQHARESTAYLVPAHIIAIVRRRRNENIGPAPDEYMLPITKPAPRPDNYEAMTAAFRSGDPHRIAAEQATYQRQLQDGAA